MINEIDELRTDGATEFKELVNKLTGQQDSKKDYTAPTTTMHARVRTVQDENDEPFQKIELEFDEILEDKSSIKHSMPMTEWGHRQMAEKCGIPITYYEKMRDAGHLGMVAANINTWINTRDRRFIRTMDGKIRAILSDKYRVLDNFEVIKAAGEKATEYGAQVVQCHLTDTRMFVKLVVPHEVHEVRAGDKLIQGICFSNSEVGAGSFRAEPFIMRLLCKNGMIGMDKLARVHLGSRMEEGMYKSTGTENLETETLYSQIKDLVEGVFDKVKFEEWIDKIQQTTEVHLNNPSDAVKNIVKEYKITEQETESILNAMMGEGDNTQYGLVNAITATAREHENQNMRIELERIGGKLSAMEGNKFQTIAARTIA